MFVKWDDTTKRWEVIANGQLIASYHHLDHRAAVRHLENIGKVIEFPSTRPTKSH